MRIFKHRYRDESGRMREVKDYYIELADHTGNVRRFTGYSDLSTTESLARQIKSLVSCRASGDSLSPELSRWLSRIPSKLRTRFARIGLIDPERAGGGKSLAEHLTDFERALQAKGNTPSYVELTVSRIRRVLNGCKLFLWSDISASRIERYLAELRQDKTIIENNKEKIERGISRQSANYYLGAVKRFCSWAVQDRRASESPIRHLKGLNVKTDRRHDRRGLSADEARHLLETTAAEPVRYGMAGPERALLYKTAIETGLRANELLTLKVSSIDFDNCVVVVEAAYSKHRREDRIPLRRDTVNELRAFTSDKLPSVSLFNMPSKWRLVDMLKDDLQAAGIEYQDTAGRFVDFHSLRHTTGTLLAAAGVHPKTAQSIMRHSTIELTMGRYTHITLGQESVAVESLPDLSQPSRQAQAKATGTDDKILPDILPFLTGQHRTTQDTAGTTNRIGDIKTPFLACARSSVGLEQRISNP